MYIFAGSVIFINNVYRTYSLNYNIQGQVGKKILRNSFPEGAHGQKEDFHRGLRVNSYFQKNALKQQLLQTQWYDAVFSHFLKVQMEP